MAAKGGETLPLHRFEAVEIAGGVGEEDEVVGDGRSGFDGS